MTAVDRIIFLGPSLPLDRAKTLLPEADFRPPIKRDDLTGIPAGTIVGIIDGVFAQSLAISPGEIRDAIAGGVRVYGAASMGALRAAEIPAVIGVGHIYRMYRSGTIERDDEVAIMLRPDTFAALTEPLVNVRFAVERLVRSGTLSRADGDEIVRAATSLHFSERTYPAIFATSRLAHNKDISDIIALLKRFDLKADDAQLLLETIAQAQPDTTSPTTANRHSDPPTYARVRTREASSAPILIWESGDLIQFADLVHFLKITGKFEQYAQRAIGHLSAAGSRLDAPGTVLPRTQSVQDAQRLLDVTRSQWGWDSPEEAHVTMRDLGLGLDDVADTLEAEATTNHLVQALAMNPTEEFNKALRVELWRDQLALKRETLRLGALEFFADEATQTGPPSAQELMEARRCITRLRRAFRWEAVVSSLAALGISTADLDASIAQIALARRAAGPVGAALDRRTTARPVQRKTLWGQSPITLLSSVKAPGSSRFSLPESDASTVANTIAEQMGIVRIGLVGELDNLGIHIAQAFGQRSGWSSSFSSGKSESREGARIGSIMEEVEIFAQDRYRPETVVRSSYNRWPAELACVQPLDLGLPYDSRYTEDLKFDWSPCHDLMNARSVYVPTSTLVGERQPNDILYSPRLGGKIFSSSGLGSGFTLAEATLHAGAEYIERHAYRLAEIEIDNPGSVGLREFRFIDDATLPETPARIAAKYHHAGVLVRIIDITSDIATPTYWVRIFDDPFKSFQSSSADGFACHPDPEVAITMALLEAAQTRGGFIAGGREDYSLRARSLGRHERPRTAAPQAQVFWFGNDRPLQPFDETTGIHTGDILDELDWMVDRVERAGYSSFLVADYATPQIRPAHAVRVLIPGLEVTNPLFTGRRARATLLRDILPHGPHTG